jgi:hypothetical protein
LGRLSPPTVDEEALTVRKRKVTYPVARTATRQPRAPGLTAEQRARATVAEIHPTALIGRKDLVVGDRVRIGGSGLYAGDYGKIESLAGGLIPAAMVRTDAGKTRRVRGVDIERISPDRDPAANRPAEAGDPA